MQQIITSLIREASSLPPTELAIAVSAAGVLLVSLAVKFLDKNAGIY
ncbi:MAG: hypothetical protein JW764_10500 [Chlorobiaceae bacterium]|nr:hypothetical protein [Chlorobiaceae bacterium]